MKNIIGIFVQRSSIFLLAIYVIISVVLMNFNDAFTQRGLRTVVLQFISWANSVENQKVYFRNLKKENRELKERLLQLSISNQQLQEVMIENIRLRRLLKFRSEHEYNYKAANVVGSSQEETVRSLILDVGSEDSIRKNLPVITDRGLVGKVLKTDKHYSIAQILMDRNSLVSARLQKSREIGVVSWSGNFWLDLRYIPKDVKVEPGENVVTSGLSSIYPEGIKIGVVAEVKENEYVLFKEIRIKPAVDFNRLEEVFVIVVPDSLEMEFQELE